MKMARSDKLLYGKQLYAMFTFLNCCRGLPYWRKVERITRQVELSVLLCIWSWSVYRIQFGNCNL